VLHGAQKSENFIYSRQKSFFFHEMSHTLEKLIINTKVLIEGLNGVWIALIYYSDCGKFQRVVYEILFSCTDGMSAHFSRDNMSQNIVMSLMTHIILR
jgi:hypothetical protein